MINVIRSMTGYGRFEGAVNGRQTVFEIKAVNHRFFELQCRLPRGCGFLEETVKELVSKYVSRGKIDVYVSVEADDSLEADVKLNRSLASGYLRALRELCSEYGLKDDISVSLLSRYTDIFTVTKAPENEEALVEIVADGVTLAFWRDTMREQGYHCFDLFRLGGNKAESLALFTGEGC